MSMPDPTSTHYLDQHAAAAAHAEYVRQQTRQLMEREQGTRFRQHPDGLGPVSLRIARRLHELSARNGIRLCPHISLAAPMPTYWTPGAAPDLVCCALCNNGSASAAEDQSIERGTWNCDGCGEEYPRSATVSGGMLTLPVPPPIPPLTATVMLCRACAVEEGVPGAEL